jgi:hypothetical protein
MLKKFVVFAVLMCCTSAHAGVVLNPRVCITADEPVLDECITPYDDGPSSEACDSPMPGSGSSLCNTAYPDECKSMFGGNGDRQYGIERSGAQSYINPPETQVVQQGSYGAEELESHTCAALYKCRCDSGEGGLGFCGRRFVDNPITEWILKKYDLNSTTECIIIGGGGGLPPE